MRERLITVALSVAATLGVMRVAPEESKRELDVDRLIVRRELIVSDTGLPWEQGFEEEQIARGIYARPQSDAPGGLWVRGRLIKAELDDPFDDRFHAMNRDRSPFRAPGHISWNIFLDGHWRQLAILQGEALELSELPADQWNGASHPGRLRFQTFRPGHQEPLTDAVLGQGKLSLGGGGFGGGGLPYPGEVLELWGGRISEHAVPTPSAPRVVSDDATGERRYQLVAVGPQGTRSQASPATRSRGFAKLAWDSSPGADAYIVIRDGKELVGPIRIEGSEKSWTDSEMRDRDERAPRE